MPATSTNFAEQLQRGFCPAAGKSVQLETELGHGIRHLDPGSCPTCGASGRFDIDGPGFTPNASNAIYFSTVFDQWRCGICDYRMCA